MENLKSKEMVKLAVQALEDKKGEDIKSLISQKYLYWLITLSLPVVPIRNQVQALVDNVDETLGRAGYEAKQMEGYATANWVLLDYNDIIVPCI